MYTFLTRNGQTIAFGIGLLLVIVTIAAIFGGVDEWSLIPDDDFSRYDTTIFNAGMYGAILLIVLCAAAALLFGVFQLATNFKGAIKGIIGLVAIVVLFYIIKGTADPSLDGLNLNDDIAGALDAGQSTFITGAIATALILAAIAVVATAVSEVINFFR